MDTSTPKPKRPFPSHVQAALSNGELWRAKEILQGTIATSKYDPLLFEQYGLVLLQMGDLVEAGKYLFLSGQAKEEYAESVALYLKRFGRRDWQTLVSSFPKRVRNIKTELLPEVVREELKRLEIPANRGNESPAQLIAPSKGRFQDTVALAGCGCVGFLIAMCFVAGFAALFQEVMGWFK